LEGNLVLKDLMRVSNEKGTRFLFKDKSKVPEKHVVTPRAPKEKRMTTKNNHVNVSKVLNNYKSQEPKLQHVLFSFKEVDLFKTKIH
jgi:hypothetical protein